MGFLLETTPVSELPLLISFEAKSLGDVKFKLAEKRMISLGYAVAKYANDGFALLRGDRMFQNNPKLGDNSPEDKAISSTSKAVLSSQLSQTEDEAPPPPLTLISPTSGQLIGPEEDMEPTR